MADYTRVFTPGGSVAHLLDSLLSPNQANSALCGRSPLWPDLWHGTGTQEEEERARDLATCSRCVVARNDRQGGVLHR